MEKEEKGEKRLISHHNHHVETHGQKLGKLTCAPRAHQGGRAAA